MPLGLDNAYGKKYAQLYAALGFRSLHPAHSGPAQVKRIMVAERNSLRTIILQVDVEQFLATT